MAAMRITGGKYRGRTVYCPPGVIRPAMDRMRTSLFSILGPLDGLSFLDLFSGSGLVGLEAASRGAAPVDLVEKDFGKKAVIQRNLAWVEEPVKLHLAEVKAFLKRADRSWDVVYADPPFPMAGKLEVLELVAERGLLKPNGSLLLHYPGEEAFPDTVGPLVRYDHREYGRSHVVFYTLPLQDAPLPV
jgi:16S rRNA (guanine(966)-N(2))-methyltransferase RsmD